MSDKLNEQADKMREMAQATLDKAKDAVSKYMAESQKIREKVDSSVQASYSSAKDIERADGKDECAVPGARKSDEQAGTRRSEQVAHCGESIGSACLWHF
jgi:hypothetical protein